ncbi:MAG: BrnT family toxin [Thiothrix litoralis]|jgi:hypothetical protein
MNTWDEQKRVINIQNHQIDFADCEAVFDLPMISKEDTRQNYGECRMQSLCLWRGQVVFVVWVERPTGAHLISVRKAEKHEQRYYFSNVTL